MELCTLLIFSLGVVFAMALVLFRLPLMLNRNKSSSETPTILSEDTKVELHGCGCQDDDKTYLWKIESQPPSYIFGFLEDGNKFEIIYDTLTLNTRTAFLYSDTVYIEKHREQKEIMHDKAKYLQAKVNETLEDLLPTHLYSKLDTVLINVVNESAIRKLNPGWVASGLHRLVERAMANEWRSAEKILQKGGFAEGLLTSAKNIGKRVETFEETDASIETYNNMPFEHYVFWIQESLAKIEFQIPDDRLIKMNKNLEKYKCGQFKGTETVFIRENAFEEWKISAKNLNEYIKNGIMTSKNNVMAARIKHHILSKGDKRLFFAVDAAHLTGQSGTTIIDILREDGFRITRVKKSDSQFKVLF